MKSVLIGLMVFFTMSLGATESKITSSVVASDEFLPKNENDQKYDTLGGSGPETMDLSEDDIGCQGNWVTKRRWLKEAEQVVRQIEDTANGINVFRGTDYAEKFKTAQKTLEDFYISNKFDRDVVDVLLEDSKNAITKKHDSLIVELKAKNPDAAVDDLSLYEIGREISTLRDLWEQAKLDIQSIDEIDRAFELRYKTIDDIVAKTMGSVIEAQRLLQQMYYVLDHRKVRERTLKIKEIFAQVQAVDAYLKNDLANDFNKLISVMNEQIEKTTNSIRSLKDKGITLQKQVDEKVVISGDDQKKTGTSTAQIVTTTTDSGVTKKIKNQVIGWGTVVSEAVITTLEWVVAKYNALMSWFFDEKAIVVKVRKAKA